MGLPLEYRVVKIESTYKEGGDDENKDEAVTMAD